MIPASLPPGVVPVFLDKAGVMPALSVETSRCRARVALQGAQLLSFARTDGRELLWLSDRARFEPGVAIRGGIPLCFPWFGPHPSDASYPAHGFARLREWSLWSASRDADDVVELRFLLGTGTSPHPGWPHAFRAEIRFRLSDDVRIAFDVHNDGMAGFPFSFALHSYFPVADIHRTRVDGLGLPIRFDGEYDRVFNTAGGHYRIIDEAGGPAIDIRATGCASAVVWNPWIAKAARLADMDADAWQHMLCVECGAIGIDAVQLAAGARARFLLRIAGD